METNPTVEAGGEKHETRDANIGNVIMFGVGLALLTAFGLAVSAGVLHYFAVHQQLGPPASPFENVRALPPAPRLQVAPLQDLGHYLAGQDRELNSYGWVDRKAGMVRIPIDRAMDRLLQKGLPARGGTSKQGAGQIKAGEVEQTVPKGYTPR